jgi:hypothetical protein
MANRDTSVPAASDVLIAVADGGLAAQVSRSLPTSAGKIRTAVAVGEF